MASDKELSEALHSLTSLNNELINQKRELERMQAELKKALDARQIAIHSVAHDLLTPVSGIVGYLELMQLSQTSEEAKKYALKAQEPLEYINNLIATLNSYAALDNPKHNFNFENANLSQICEKALTSFQTMAQAARVTISFQSEGSEFSFFADILHIQRAVTNIVGNAIRFSPPDTTLNITAHATPEIVQFSCRDHGPGIPPDIIDRIFDPFFRAPAQKSRGLGLGLAIVEQVIKAHGGTVRAQNSPHGGAIFSFEIPRERK